MHRWRKQESDSHGFQAFGDASRRQSDIDSQRLNYISRSTLRSIATIAMLCDPDTRPGHGERGGSRDVESSAGIAAGAAGIDQRVAFCPADVEREVMHLQRRRCLANRFSEANDLLHCFAFHVKSDKERSD